jgi:hypothetical protein
VEGGDECLVAGRGRQRPGQFVVAWEDWQDWSKVVSISAQAFGAAGRPASPLVSIVPEGEVDVSAPVVGIDPAGRFVLLWRQSSRAMGNTVLRGQRFGRDGRLLGVGFTIPLDGKPSVLPDGGFVVAGKLAESSGLELRRFTRDGIQAGPAASFYWSPGTVLDMATDSHGNVALLAYSTSPQEMVAHLFNRDFVPQGRPIRIAPVHAADQPDPFGSGGALALSDAGCLVIAWNGPRTIPEQDVEWIPLYARVWHVLRDADACVRRGSLFLCDTAGDGYGAEVSISLGSGWEPAMLADWDGDGRDDPCIYRRGRFVCSTDHQGRVLEVSPRIGRSGDEPFLGDLNGDGRADPCVRRGSLLLCDWRRNGNPEGLRIDFGLPGDTFLLGDPDGDGRDDPCVYRDGRILCDTAHDGGAAEVELYMSTTWGDTPLLGDVNGDGRDDACLWKEGWLECGIFHPEGGFPLEWLEVRSFGQAGDTPLLGDLDAF